MASRCSFRRASVAVLVACLVGLSCRSMVARGSLTGPTTTTVLFKLKEEAELADYNERAAGAPAREAVRAAEGARLTNVRRVFREAGVHEARHRRVGAHLYFEADVSIASDIATEDSAFSRSVIARDAARSLQRDPAVSFTEVRRDDAAELFSQGGGAMTGDGAGFFNHESGPIDPALIPDDALFFDQGYLRVTHAYEAWAITKGSPDVVVAVMDSGAGFHPDLSPNFWRNAGETDCDDGIDNDRNGYVDDCHGYNFSADDGKDLIGISSHGAHVAGTVAARSNNTIGVAGLAGGDGARRGVSLMILCTFGEPRQRGFGEAHFYAADMGASIAQQSWGYTQDGTFPRDVRLGIDYFNENARGSVMPAPSQPPWSPGAGWTTPDGGMVVFAAGNDGSMEDVYPCFYAGVTCVGATTPGGADRDRIRRAPYSNMGSHVDISAPGYVINTLLSDNYGYKTGTSMAAPQVSGTLALMISARPGYGRDAYLGCLFGTAFPMENVAADRLGAGLLDVGAAVRCIDAYAERDTECAAWSGWSDCQVDCSAVVSREGTARVAPASAEPRSVWESLAGSAFRELDASAETFDGFGGNAAGATSLSLCGALELASDYTARHSGADDAASIRDVMVEEGCLGAVARSAVPPPALAARARARARTSTSRGGGASAAVASASRALARVRGAFAAADLDGDQMMSVREARLALASVAPSASGGDASVADDADGDLEALVSGWGNRKRTRVDAGPGCPAATVTTACSAVCDTRSVDDDGGDEVRGCFDGDAMVLLGDGSEKRMADLAIGDHVATVVDSNASTGGLTLSSSPVLAFAHRDPDGGGARRKPAEPPYPRAVVLLEVHVIAHDGDLRERSTFMASNASSAGHLGDTPHRGKDAAPPLPPLTSADELAGRDAPGILRLTPNHMIPVLRDGRGEDTVVLAARHLRAGMRVALADMNGGGAGRVTVGTVADVVARDRPAVGAEAVQLIAPMTLTNNLVVDGVVVSCATEGMFLASSPPSPPHHASAIGVDGADSGRIFGRATRDVLLTAMLVPIYAFVLARELAVGMLSWASSGASEEDLALRKTSVPDCILSHLTAPKPPQEAVRAASSAR